MTEETVNEKLDRLNSYFEIAKNQQEKPKKDTLLPFKLRKTKAIIKKGKVLVLFLKPNGNIDPTAIEIINGMISYKGKYYNASPEFLWHWRGKTPAYVIPEWDINPLCGKNLHEEAEKEGRIIHPQVIIIRAIKQQMVGMNSAMGGKMWIWIILGAAVVLYMLFGQGGAP